MSISRNTESWVLATHHLHYEALQAENKIGMLLPCNVIMQELPDGKVEVAAIDPMQSMQVVENPALKDIAEQVQAKLRNVINNM